MDTYGESAGSRSPGPGTAETVSPDAPSLDEVVGRIAEISTLPHVALKVIEVAGNPNCGAGDLKAVVEADPALCVRVLRCVNSAAYGLRSQISDLNQAVSFLGLNRIRDLAVTASVSGLFRTTRPVGTYQRPELWRHMAAVGICARMISVRNRTEGFEDAFLAGLLHDIGIILFDQNCHAEFRAVINSLTPQASLCEIEQRTVGWDHTQLGARVGERWRLPPSVIASIRFHHEPELHRGPDKTLVHCVAVANLLCSIKEITSVGRNLVGLPAESLGVLGIDKSDLRVLAADLDREMELHRQLFQIQRGN